MTYYLHRFVEFKIEKKLPLSIYAKILTMNNSEKRILTAGFNFGFEIEYRRPKQWPHKIYYCPHFFLNSKIIWHKLIKMSLKVAVETSRLFQIKLTSYSVANCYSSSSFNLSGKQYKLSCRFLAYIWTDLVGKIRKDRWLKTMTLSCK